MNVKVKTSKKGINPENILKAVLYGGCLWLEGDARVVILEYPNQEGYIGKAREFNGKNDIIHETRFWYERT